MTARERHEDNDRTVEHALPATPQSGAEPGPADLPAQLGHHVVGQELKQGGMGRIVRVWDDDFKRPLALKLVRERDPRLEQRLVYEGRLTGCLQHPGIPPVHDQGRLPDGRPYFIMKLIQGASLGELLRRRSFPAEELPRFLLIFEQLCAAVGYAHSRQVIHRDLKPGNVMVGAHGEVQLIDWGLAKLVRPTATAPPSMEDEPCTMYGLKQTTVAAGLETTVGSALGTPGYMAPEQARGELDGLDARADVFGLGAILCEVLTGIPPYRSRDNQEVHHQARRADLADTWERLAGCGADDEVVALARACLAPEREKRPTDGAAVAQAVAAYRQEVQRRLQAAEVEAATAAARAEEEKKLRVAESARADEEVRRRQVERQRRRLAVGLAAAVVLLVLVGSGVWLWVQGEEVRQETARLLQQQEEQGRRQRNAEALADLLDRCDAALRDNNAVLAEVTLAAADRRLGEAGGEALRARAERCRTDLALLRKLDAIDTFRWTPLENRLPDPKTVAARWRTALAGYGLTPAQGEEATAVRVLGSVLRDRLLLVLDLWLEAEPAAWVRGILRRADADPYREAVRDVVVAGDVVRLGELAERVEALAQPARFAAALGQNGKVAVERRRVVLETALRSRPGDLTLLMALGGSYPISQREGAEERVRWLQAALAAHPRNVTAYNNLGVALVDKKDVEGAVAAYKEAIRLDPKYAHPHNDLGLALYGKQDVAGAIAAYKEAIRLDPKLAPPHYGLGTALLDKKDVEGAIAACKEAIRLDPKYALPHYNLGLALYGKQDVEGAVAAFKEAIHLDPKFALPHNGLGNALRDKKDVEGAMAAFKEAIRLDPKFAYPHHGLGNALYDKKDVEGAIAAYKEAIRLDPKYAHPHNDLGLALYGKQDVAGAIAAYKEAIRLDPKLADAYASLGQALLQAGQFTEAREATRRALQLLPPSHPLHKVVRQQLRRCDDLLVLDGKLPGYLKQDPPATQPQELLSLSDLCRVYKQYHATAARLAAVAFTAQPALAENLTAGHRYQAARSAALAAAGQGRDPGKLSPEDRTKLRAQALAWLQADLRQWTIHFQDRDPKALLGLLTVLPAWQQETAFAPLRAPKERAALPPDERQAWTKLWADVDQLVKQVAANIRTQRFTGTLTAGEKERTHEVKWAAGQAYVIDLESTQFDAFLRLHDAKGKLLAENDDILPGVNTNARLFFKAPAAGNYRLVATSFEQRGLGNYTLTVRSFVPAKKE